MSKKYFFLLAGFLSIAIFTSSLKKAYSEEPLIRIGHFPNLTHAQAVIGHEDDWFKKKFDRVARVEWKIFSAGPSVIEALFAGDIDIAYIGPNPAINGYVKSEGDALCVIAGAAQGGSALVVRQDSGIQTIQDFHNKKIATPQLGNTQDITLRSWLRSQGLKMKEQGGDIQVLPITNADQVTLFLKKEIDAAWTVEPWVSLLEKTAGGKVFLEESSFWKDGKYLTTLVIARKKFLDRHPELVKKFLETHVELTEWIQKNPEQAKNSLNRGLEKETHKTIAKDILDKAFDRITFSYEAADSVKIQGLAAFHAGFLKEDPDLSGFFDLRILKEVLAAKVETGQQK